MTRVLAVGGVSVLAGVVLAAAVLWVGAELVDGHEYIVF